MNTSQDHSPPPVVISMLRRTMSTGYSARNAKERSENVNHNNTNLPSIVARGSTEIGPPVSVSTIPSLPLPPFLIPEESPEASQTIGWISASASMSDSLQISIDGDDSYTTSNVAAVTISGVTSTWTVTLSTPATASILRPSELGKDEEVGRKK